MPKINPFIFSVKSYSWFMRLIDTKIKRNNDLQPCCDTVTIFVCLKFYLGYCFDQCFTIDHTWRVHEAFAYRQLLTFSLFHWLHFFYYLAWSGLRRQNKVKLPRTSADVPINTPPLTLKIDHIAEPKMRDKRISQ